MAHFEVTVRVFDVVEADAVAARQAVEERLRGAGFSRWQVVSVALPRAATAAARAQRRRPLQANATYAGGGILLAAVVAWALWFLWLLLI